jgi:Alr-MurF fusion protein
MVKAFSYGAGSFEIANLLQYSRVDYLAVAYADEGVELRKAGIRMPIMVMNTERDSFPMLLQYDLEPEIFSIEIAEALSRFLHREGIEYFPIHVKLDTGMHRLGFNEDRLQEFVSSGMLQTSFKVRTVFTHLSASEDPRHDEFTLQQIDAFDKMSSFIQSALGYRFMRHVANTSASIRFPNSTYEMVRLGIGLYGIDPSQTHGKLTEAVSLKTTIAQINHVKSGESVGYGRAAIMKRDSVIATIRIGYADGFPRALGNGAGSVYVNGQEAKTVGNICMDMCMIDVTDLARITLSDEVEVFGLNRSIIQVAKEAGTIPYEIMTGISQRVPRVYIS